MHPGAAPAELAPPAAGPLPPARASVDWAGLEPLRAVVPTCSPVAGPRRLRYNVPLLRRLGAEPAVMAFLTTELPRLGPRSIGEPVPAAAIQLAAAEVFALVPPEEARRTPGAGAYFERHGPALQSFVRIAHEASQRWLRERDVPESVMLWYCQPSTSPDAGFRVVPLRPGLLRWWPRYDLAAESAAALHRARRSAPEYLGVDLVLAEVATSGLVVLPPTAPCLGVHDEVWGVIAGGEAWCASLPDPASLVPLPAGERAYLRLAERLASQSGAGVTDGGPLLDVQGAEP